MKKTSLKSKSIILIGKAIQPSLSERRMLIRFQDIIPAFVVKEELNIATTFTLLLSLKITNTKKLHIQTPKSKASMMKSISEINPGN